MGWRFLLPLINGSGGIGGGVGVGKNPLISVMNKKGKDMANNCSIFQLNMGLSFQVEAAVKL